MKESSIPVLCTGLLLSLFSFEKQLHQFIKIDGPAILAKNIIIQIPKIVSLGYNLTITQRVFDTVAVLELHGTGVVFTCIHSYSLVFNQSLHKLLQ